MKATPNQHHRTAPHPPDRQQTLRLLELMARVYVNFIINEATNEDAER